VIVWLAALIYWMGVFFYRLEGLQVFVLGYAAVLVLLPLPLPSVKPLTHTDLPAFRVHLIIALAAFSLFTIASLQALMMAVLERRLRQGPLPPFLQSLPPLLTLERLLFRIIAAGFALLTLTLASGMLYSEELFGQPLRFTHKVVFAIAAWFIFAPRCWPAAESTAGADAWRCAGRSPGSWRWCWPTSAPSSCSKSARQRGYRNRRLAGATRGRSPAPFADNPARYSAVATLEECALDRSTTTCSPSWYLLLLSAFFSISKPA
jgi:hypothetical protein